MNKLGRWLDNWWDGNMVKGIQPRMYELDELTYIYNELRNGNNPETIMSNVKHILNLCGIRTEERGVGWICYV